MHIFNHLIWTKYHLLGVIFYLFMLTNFINQIHYFEHKGSFSELLVKSEIHYYIKPRLLYYTFYSSQEKYKNFNLKKKNKFILFM